MLIGKKSSQISNTYLFNELPVNHCIVLSGTSNDLERAKRALNHYDKLCKSLRNMMKSNEFLNVDIEVDHCRLKSAVKNSTSYKEFKSM